MSRVAVQLGAHRLRMAIADPRPRLLADLQVPESGAPGALLARCASLLDRPADELVVVHGPGGPPVVPAGVASVVRFVPGALAALGGVDGAAAPVAPVSLDRTLPDAVVVDAGHGGTDVARLVGGRIVASRRVLVGGAVLDAVTADLIVPAEGNRSTVDRAAARAARETLSLSPVVRVGHPPVDLDAHRLHRALVPSLTAVVDAVRVVVDAGPEGPPPVLLVGGVARTPLLAELLDAAGLPDVRVAPHPDSAAVVGALRLPSRLLGPPHASATAVPASRAAPSGPPLDAGSASPASASMSAPCGGAPVPFWLPPVAPVRNRPLRALAVATAAVVAVAGLYSAGTALPAADPAPLAGDDDLVQYGYAVRLPAGWVHTGGLPERRRSLLTPAHAPDGGDLVSVERTPLGYDADAEPRRARAELRAEFDRAVRAGAALSGFDDDARVAGRRVVTYRETTAEIVGGADGNGRGADAAEVDWYVVLDGDAQLSIGCRHTAAGAAAVEAACATVLGSLRRTT